MRSIKGREDTAATIDTTARSDTTDRERLLEGLTRELTEIGRAILTGEMSSEAEGTTEQSPSDNGATITTRGLVKTIVASEAMIEMLLRTELKRMTGTTNHTDVDRLTRPILRRRGGERGLATRRRPG